MDEYDEELVADDVDDYGGDDDDDIDIDDPADEEMEQEQGDEDVLRGLCKVDTINGFFLHKDPVYTVASLGELVVSGGGDDKSFVWNAYTGEVVRELQAHTDSVVSSGFSNDGQFLATGGMDGRLLVYRTASGEQILNLEGPSEVTWLNWHPRGNVLLAGSADGTIWMYTVPSGNCMNVFSSHGSTVTCGKFTPDGRSIVSGGEDGHLFVYDPKTAAVKANFRPDDSRFLGGSSVTSLSVHADSQVVLAGGQDGSSSLVHLGNGKVLGVVSKADDSIESTGFSPHLPLASVASIDGTIAIWDVALMRLRETQRHAEGVTKTIWLQNSPLLLSCSLDKTVKLWDMRTGKFARSYLGHTGPILDMVVGDDERIVISCGDDGSAQVFEIN